MALPLTRDLLYGLHSTIMAGDRIRTSYLLTITYHNYIVFFFLVSVSYLSVSPCPQQKVPAS